jgi:3-hydroxyacyl-[acyl-carrier-protein] dehydratase
MRWIWIDKFVEFTSKKSATAVKNVTMAEEHLHDLYPAFPIVPHSLIVEGMAQLNRAAEPDPIWLLRSN